MNKSSFMTRATSALLALILLLGEGNIFAAYAAETDAFAPPRETERVELTGEEISEILGGDSDLTVTFSPEAEAALNQTMEEIARLLENGQMTYDEETGYLVLTDPYADLSGLNLSGFQSLTDENGDQRVIAGAGMASDEADGFVLLSQGLTSAPEGPTDEELPSAEEPPTEEEPPVDEELPIEEEQPTEEEPPSEEELPVEEELPDGDELLPGENENTAEVTDGEAELLWWNDCKHKATKSAKVPYYNTYKDGRKKKGTIAAKDTVVKVVDSKRNGIFGSLYYKVTIKNVGTYWVHSDNLKKHECTANSVTKATEYDQISGNNSKHWKITTTPAKSCTKCDCPIAEKDIDKSKADHSWNGVGICKDCGYDFKETKDNCTDTVYMVNKNNVVLRKAPYSAATPGRTLHDGDSVLVTHTAKNAFHSLFDPHVWYLTDKGDWIYSGNAEKHKHTYNSNSTKTGKCTVCGRMYKFDIIPMNDTGYQVAVDHDVPIRQYPYSQSTAVAYTDASTIYTVDAHTYSDPNGSYWDKGDKWYRIKGTGWVKYSDIKEHVTHKYNQTYGGVCLYSGCSEEFTLKPKKMTATAYETLGSNVVARSQPYAIGAARETYSYKSSIVSITGTVTNSLKEVWLRTAENTWIKSSDLKLHVHNLKVGVCTSVGCSYISSVNTVSCRKYTGELTLPGQLKEKPFDDSKTVKTLPVKSCLTINGSCVVEGKKWFRTTNGLFIDASCIKKHAHTYQGGFCSPCGSYESWTGALINPMVVTAKSAGTAVREKPYAVAPVTRTLTANEQIVIVQKCTNSLKKTWYQLMDGTWIYADNVKTLNGAKVTTSNKLAVDNYTLTLVDDCGDPIEGATVEWVGEAYTSNADGKVSLAYVTTKTDLTIKCSGYDTVTLKGHTMSTSRKETVIMALAGSFRATEVIMDYLGSKFNVLRTSKNLNKYHTQGIFQEDFTLTCKVSDSMADKIGKFQLVQGTDVIATSKTGKFTGLDVGDFYDHKTVYLKVFDKNGKERAKQDLRLNIFNEGLDGTTPNLNFGFGSLNITIPVGCPLIGGFEIKIDPPTKLKVTMDIDDDSTKYSIEYNGDEDYNSSIGAYKDYWNKIKTMKKDGWRNYFNKKQIASAGSKLKWEVAAGGYYEKMHGEDVANGKIYVCVSAKISKGWQFVTPIGIPMVAEISFKGQGTVGGAFTIKEAKITDFSIPLDLSFAIEASGGVGVRHIGEVSFFGQASLGLEFQLVPPDWDETNIFLRASLGIKAKALGAELFRFTFLESPVLYIVQEGQFVLFEGGDPYAVLLDTGSYTPIQRSYLYARSGWYGAGAELMEDVSVSISDMDVEVLQSSTYTDLKPQVVTADDGTVMMLYTDDNARRADIDRTMLVFSLYDAATGRWTEPQPVQDDGTGDYGVSAHSVGDDIYLVWQNAKSTHAASADVTDVSRSLEVTVAKYDAVAGEFTCIEQLTDNDTYENMPRISAVNGQVVVSWFTNNHHSVFQTSGENTVWYAVKTEADYDTREPYSDVIDFSAITDTEQEVPVEEESSETYEDPAPTAWTVSAMDPVSDTITSMAVGYMLNSGYVAYTTDADGNTATTEDQYIHLINAVTGQLMAYTDQACNVEFTRVHGDNAMTWYNRGTIYYALDPAYAPMMLLDEEIVADVNLGNDYQIISDHAGNMAILSTRNGNSCSNAYIMLYDDANFQWGLPVAVTDQELYIRDFYGAYHEGTIISIFNRTAIDPNTYAESNSLCSAIINQRTDLTVSDVYVDTYKLEPLADAPVTLTVTNNGTSRVDGFTVCLYDSEDNLLSTVTSPTALRMGQSATVNLSVTMGETIRQATYRLEVTADGAEDDHPENNEYLFDVGVPHLVMEAENQSTETEDIVVLTVTNAGYGELGGSIVLLDDSGAVTDVVVEEFAPVDHDSEYTCAILFSEEYFAGEPNAVFRFGIIPTGANQVEYETSIYVDKVRPADSADLIIDSSELEGPDGDAVLMDAVERNITGTVRNDTAEDLVNAVLIASAYDTDGIWLDSYTETVTLPSEESLTFTATFLTEGDIESVTVTLLDGETMEPLINAVQLTVSYDTISA